MAKRARRRYTAKKKATILAAAAKQNLTAPEVQKRFGVKPVTYYSWRKKSGVSFRTRGARRGAGVPAGLDSALRSRIQARLGALMPKIVEREVDAFLARYFGGGQRRRRKT